MSDVCWTYVGRVLDVCWTSKPYSCLCLAHFRLANLFSATIWRTLGAQAVPPLMFAAPQARKPIPCYHLAHARRRSRCPACVWAGTGGRVGSGAYRHTQLPFNSQPTPIQPPLTYLALYQSQRYPLRLSIRPENSLSLDSMLLTSTIRIPCKMDHILLQ